MAGLVGLEVGEHAHTVISLRGQLVEEVGGAGCAVDCCVVLALIAFWVGTWVAGAIDQILEGIFAASCLAAAGGKVKVGIGTAALPGHHVEDVGLVPAETAVSSYHPGEQHVDSKGLDPVNGFIFELPLVLESALCIYRFEGGDSHDEVVFEFDGYLKEASVFIIVPFLEDDEIFL